MAAVTYISAVLLLHLMGPVTAIPCSDAPTWNKSHAYKQLTFPSVLKCATECVASPVCASLKFGLETKTCSLYSNSIAHADVASAYLEPWTKLPSGIRESMLSRVRMCGTEDKPYNIFTRACGEPPDVFGSVRATKHHPQGSVTTYTCQPDFISCDKDSIKTSRCQTSGLWENVSLKCEQFHLHSNEPTNDYYVPCGPSRKIHINIWGTPPTPNNLVIDVQHEHDILLHVEVRFKAQSQNTKIVVNTRVQQWGSEANVNVFWQVGQTGQLCITMVSGTYKVKLNGTTVHTRSEPKEGIDPSTMYISPSFKVRELKFIRLD